MKKLRVLAVTPYFAPDVSGAAAYIGDSLSGLLDDGHEVAVLHQSAGAVPSRDRVEVHRVFEPGRGMTSVATVRASVALHRERPFDLVLAGVAHPAGLIAVTVGGLLRRPVAVLALGEDLAGAARSRVTRTCLQVTLRRAGHVLAASGDTMGRVRAVGGHRVRGSVLLPAIDADPFVSVDPQARATVRAKLGLGSARVVLTTARLEARKGHDVVLRAIARLGEGFEDVHYLVIGRGDTAVLRALARELGVGDRLVVVDHVTDEELPAYYAAADVFAMLSRPGPNGEVDGFGIVYLEAAASGLPVVAGNLGGCRDAVEEGTTAVCVDPTDDRAACEALRGLLSDPDRAAAMGVAGRARVEAGFQRSVMREVAARRLTALALGHPVPVP